MSIPYSYKLVYEQIKFSAFLSGFSVPWWNWAPSFCDMKHSSNFVRTSSKSLSGTVCERLNDVCSLVSLEDINGSVTQLHLRHSASSPCGRGANVIISPQCASSSVQTLSDTMSNNESFCTSFLCFVRPYKQAVHTTVPHALSQSPLLWTLSIIQLPSDTWNSTKLFYK